MHVRIVNELYTHEFKEIIDCQSDGSIDWFLID